MNGSSWLEAKLDEEVRAFLLDLIHEARRLNHVIKASSEIISRGTRGDNIDKKNVNFHSDVVFDNSYLLSLWLDLVELEINPNVFAAEPASPRRLYGKFYKAAISFRRIGKEKSIKIDVRGVSQGRIDCHPVIDILPYILLDNAIKYSPSHGGVDVVFFENSKEIEVTVSSMGPILADDEKPRLGEKYFRGAQSTKYRGSGRGLFFAKFICNLHGARIYFNLGDHRATYEGVPFGDFTVRIVFPR